MTTTSPDRATVRVLLVDDHQIIRDSIEVLLLQHPAFSVVGHADNGLDAIAMCRQMPVDVVVLDMDLPGVGGLEVISQVSASLREPPAFVILSMFGDPSLAQQAVDAGALGYVHKSSGLQEVLKAIESVAAGTPYLCARMKAAVSVDRSGTPDAADRRLTAREREVLACIAMGMNAKETARRLDISPATVHVFRGRIRVKLGARSQAEMVRAGIRLGLSGIETPQFD
jgi:two-component system, NarL family, nitrate/nitrite response regulator NarL